MLREIVSRSWAAARRPAGRVLAGWVLGTLVLIWLVGAIDWSAALSTLTRLRIEWIGASALGIALHTLARAQRWRVLFYPSPVRLRPALTAMLVGQALNYWLPVRLGDVPRILWLSRHTGFDKSRTIGTLLVEKLWDALPLIAVFLLMGWLVNLPPAIADPMRAAGALGALAGLVLILVAVSTPAIERLASRPAARSSGPIRARLSHIVRGLLLGVQTLRTSAALARAAFWTAAAWTLGALANWLAFQSLQLPLGWEAALLISAALRVGVSLSTIPAALGIYEGSVVLGLSIFSIPPDVALSCALVMHAIDLLVPLGMLALLLAGHARSTLPQPGK